MTGEAGGNKGSHCRNISPARHRPYYYYTSAEITPRFWTSQICHSELCSESQAPKHQIRTEALNDKLMGYFCRGVLRSFLCHLDPDERIVILRSSEDLGLRRMFAVFGGLGSTHLDADGKIYVQIDDARGANKAIWLEELAHARQCI